MSKTSLAMILLVVLSLVWGLGWPMISLGLPYCPALWYSALRYIGATVIAFVILTMMRQLVLPTREDIPLIFSVGFLQMGLFVLLFTVGLKYVPPGRSSIIAYLSPLFVTPVAVIWFGENLTPNKIIGLLLGLAGIFVLFSPWEFNWHDRQLLIGNGLLLLSAIAWSAAMLHIRYAKWHRPSHQLLPWQLVVAMVLSIFIAVIIDPHPHIVWNHPFILSIVYAALFNTLVGYFLSTLITRYLPIMTTSLGLLAVPVVSLLSSAWLVNERLTIGIITAMLLIITGLACVAIGRE